MTDAIPTVVPNNLQQNVNSAGLLHCDCDEIYCNYFTSQCNIFGLHVLEHDVSVDSVLVVSLVGKISRYFLSPNDKVQKIQFDLRDELPSSNDWEVTCSYLHRLHNRWLLLLACSDVTHSSDLRYSPGLLVVVGLTPASSVNDSGIKLIRWMSLNCSPTLISRFPIVSTRQEISDPMIIVTGSNDRSIHGYQLKLDGYNKEADEDCSSFSISLLQCFLGEKLPEFGSGLRRPGSITAFDTLCFNNYRFTAMGFDTGHVIIVSVDLEENTLFLGDMLERRFDSPIVALRLLVESDGSEGHEEHRLLSLICPAAGSTRLYTKYSDSGWTETIQNFPRSEQNDCVTGCLVINQQNHRFTVLLCTFSGRLLIYMVDSETKTATLQRVHTFLSAVMQLKEIDERRIAVLLIDCFLLFEL